MKKSGSKAAGSARAFVYEELYDTGSIYDLVKVWVRVTFDAARSQFADDKVRYGSNRSPVS